MKRRKFVKHREPLLKHCETSRNTRTLAIRRHSMRRYWSLMWRHRRSVGRDRRSARRYRRSRVVSSDCGVGITPQMCNRVTNHGDMGTFSKPESMDRNDIFKWEIKIGKMGVINSSLAYTSRVPGAPAHKSQRIFVIVIMIKYFFCSLVFDSRHVTTKE